MGKELEIEVRKVDLKVVTSSADHSGRKRFSNKLTDQEHKSCAMGKFQNVLLFGIGVEAPDLSIPCNHVEPIPQRDDRNI